MYHRPTQPAPATHTPTDASLSWVNTSGGVLVTAGGEEAFATRSSDAVSGPAGQCRRLRRSTECFVAHTMGMGRRTGVGVTLLGALLVGPGAVCAAGGLLRVPLTKGLPNAAHRLVVNAPAPAGGHTPGVTALLDVDATKHAVGLANFMDAQVRCLGGW